MRLQPDVPSPQEPRAATLAWLRNHGMPAPGRCHSCLQTSGHKSWCWYGRAEPADEVQPDIARYWQEIADGISARSWLLEEVESR